MEIHPPPPYTDTNTHTFINRYKHKCCHTVVTNLRNKNKERDWRENERERARESKRESENEREKERERVRGSERESESENERGSENESERHRERERERESGRRRERMTGSEEGILSPEKRGHHWTTKPPAFIREDSGGDWPEMGRVTGDGWSNAAL